MIVYKPRVEEGYQWAIPVDPHDYRIFRSLTGERLADRWSPVRMYILQSDEGRLLQQSDMPWLGSHALILTRRAKDTLGDMLAKDCEFLPLICDEEDLWLVNPVVLTDALDEQQAEFKRFPNSERIMRMYRYAFRDDVIAGYRCFRIPEQVPIFVTEDVVEAVDAADLRGVGFEAIWHSR